MRHSKILIVDDDIDNLNVIIRHVEEDQEPYELLQALSGEAAFEIAMNEIPDLIIADWEMPVMNGIELIKKLKEDDRTSNIPVIMCTGAMLTSEDLRMALQAGAVDYIRKPIDKIELLARIQATLRLSASYKEIQELNNSKDKIFSIIAHDLRGPIGNFKNLIQVVLEELADSDGNNIREIIELIDKQSTSAYYILDNLLSWALSQQNQLTFEPLKQALFPVVKVNIDLLANDAVQKNIKILNNVDESIEAFFDETLISVVIRNIIANAIKFTNKNGIISINCKLNNACIEVSVSDNGIGISPERIDSLFNETSFEPTFGTNHEKGSGLGLKLCKTFVEKNNGKIWLESKLEKGTTFYFTIPI